jgi:hypothetical protein
MHISTKPQSAGVVAKATRHVRWSPGCMFTLRLSEAYAGIEPNLDQPEASR